MPGIWWLLPSEPARNSRVNRQTRGSSHESLMGLTKFNSHTSHWGGGICFPSCTSHVRHPQYVSEQHPAPAGEAARLGKVRVQDIASRRVRVRNTTSPRNGALPRTLFPGAVHAVQGRIQATDTPPWKPLVPIPPRPRQCPRPRPTVAARPAGNSSRASCGQQKGLRKLMFPKPFSQASREARLVKQPNLPPALT